MVSDFGGGELQNFFLDAYNKETPKKESDKLAEYERRSRCRTARRNGISEEELNQIDQDLQKKGTEFGEDWTDAVKHQNLIFIEKRMVFASNASNFSAVDEEITEIIAGTIKDKKVKIIKSRTVFTERTEGCKFDGSINGKKLSTEDAERLFTSYERIAKKRTESIEALMEQKRKERNRDKENKRHERTAGDLKEVL